jgi:hypothetical protein
MMDGDHTYHAYEMLRVLEPLMSDFCDVVVGSRLSGKLKKNALNAHKRLANWGFTFLVRHFYKANITDVLSGYFAWKKEVVDELQKHINSDGFAIEMEMITKSVKLGHEMFSVPITYSSRKGVSKVDSFGDGWHILMMFFKNLNWKPNRYMNTKGKKRKNIQHKNPSFQAYSS